MSETNCTTNRTMEEQSQKHLTKWRWWWIRNVVFENEKEDSEKNKFYTVKPETFRLRLLVIITVSNTQCTWTVTTLVLQKHVHITQKTTYKLSELQHWAQTEHCSKNRLFCTLQVWEMNDLPCKQTTRISVSKPNGKVSWEVTSLIYSVTWKIVNSGIVLMLIIFYSLLLFWRK